MKKYIRSSDFTPAEEAEMTRCADMPTDELLKLLVDITGYLDKDEATYVAVIYEVAKRLGYKLDPNTLADKD